MTLLVKQSQVLKNISLQKHFKLDVVAITLKDRKEMSTRNDGPAMLAGWCDRDGQTDGHMHKWLHTGVSL